MALAVQSAAVALTGDGTNGADGSRSAAGTGDPITEAANEQAAKLAAVLQGHRVEVLSARAEDSTTWANPDGTMTTDLASGPIRVEENGQWRRIDTDLVDSGSRLEPKTAVADVRLSDGGAEDFAQVADGERAFGLDWGSSLPAPTVDGDTAVYRSVVPNGDLHVTALPHGFTESLILKERPAEPVELRLPVTLKGMTLEKTAERHLRLEDATGTLVASAPAPRMWGTGTDSRSGDPVKSAEIATTVEETADGTVLVLKPSQEFLDDPAVAYPVTIDPTTTLAASTDTWVATNYPDSQRGSAELKAGTYDGGTTKARSYVKFDVAKYAGKHILSAELRLHSYWSSTCATDGSGVEVRRITGSWDPSAVTWGAQPATTTTGSVVSKAAYGYSSACPANFMRWNVKDIAQSWANGESNNGLQIRAVDEQDSKSWRRFRSANYVDGSQGPTEPALSVTYNTKPGAASAVSPAADAFTADTTPTLQAKATDADGNTVRLGFEVWNWAGTTRVASGTSAYVASGTTGSWTAPTLASGTYKWRANVYAGTDWNSTWSAWRNLTVDTSVPAAPTLTSTTYPADGLWHGDAGTAGTFTLADPAGKATSAEYRLDEGSAQTTTLASGKSTLTLTPTTRGTHTLTARVKNAAGVWSDRAEYTFLAGNITGTLAVPFVNEIAETHFADLLHPADGLEETDELDEEIADEDDTPAGYVEQEDPEKTETEDSTVETATTELPSSSVGTLTGNSADGAAQTLIDLPVASSATAELSETGLVIYANTQTDADTVAVRGSASQVELFHLLRSANAPKTFVYKVKLQPGQEISAVSDNTLMIADANSDLATFLSAPVAVDAKGATVPVTMKATGSDVEVSLAPAAGQTLAYPVLLDPSGSSYTVTPTERSYCFWNPYDCAKAREMAGTALRYAQDLYPDRTLFQGTGDAFRHCYWNALMEVFVDHETAYEVATRHESQSSGVDKEMDLKNNKKGREIGRYYKARYSKAEAWKKTRSSCKSHVSKGKLWIIRSGRLVKSNA
ncbi:DNRLRE domain-containing protein [Streptomyces sp. NBC_00986]|uniref:DNRLRE domain-containing protein n=1 Tax=Streptomyces sp. NBC_00986 TaxID=2903702 RepID=UPI003866494C|nr:DNRLRE domain-containing protein [Streptomyces sp. NBC_00986]